MAENQEKKNEQIREFGQIELQNNREHNKHPMAGRMLFIYYY